MIRYKSDLFGLRTLLQWDGSAAIRAIIPASVSTIVCWMYWIYWQFEIDELVLHPYAIAVMIGFFGFLLTTRLNFAYSRWWEATTMSHRMTSKLMDSALCLAAFHCQSKVWESPMTYGEEYAGKGNIEAMKSQRLHNDDDDPMLREMKEGEKSNLDEGNHPTNATSESLNTAGNHLFRWLQRSLFGGSSVTIQDQTEKKKESKTFNRRSSNRRAKSEPSILTKSFQPNKRILASQRSISTYQPTRSDFLDEMVHLYSLLVAVAMASLRHDVEGCPSPLSQYNTGDPLPSYNSVYCKRRNTEDNRSRSDHWSDKAWHILYFFSGMDWSPKQRTLYNASRPFGVLGGISESEVRHLQIARGPVAQVALVQLWLKEFIAREYLHGSTGQVAPPIVGRVFHFLTDGIAAYHQCRKVAYVPFPFPHEQMTRLFTWVIVFFFPILYVAFVNTPFLAYLLNFVTILCFQGIFEVAQDLSSPYDTVPNDMPLNRFHSEFNESLRTLLTGFHPNSREREN